MLSCRESKLFWKATGLNPFKRLFGAIDWINFFSDYANDDGTKDLERLRILLWHYWNLRNDSNF